jgi:tetratricopeptide (TPR) repeat protein
MKRAFALAVCLFFTPALALGGTPSDKDRARELAQQAADLLDTKKYAEALDAANQAESLYHAVYHLYVAARSLEGLGRLIEAADTYDRLLAEPLPSTAPKVFRDAQADSKKYLADLLAQIPTVLVRVSGVSADAAKATLDDKPLDIASGIAVRVDPGSHVVRVTADGRTPFEKTISLPNKGGVVFVDAALPTVGGQTAPPVVTNVSGSSFVPAIAAFGVGAVGLALGSVMGGLELGKVKELEKLCPNKACPAEAQPDLDKANELASISTVGFVVGGVGVAAGVVLLVVRKKAPVNSSAGVLAVPWVGPGMVGVAGKF